MIHPHVFLFSVQTHYLPREMEQFISKRVPTAPSEYPSLSYECPAPLEVFNLRLRHTARAHWKNYIIKQRDFQEGDESQKSTCKCRPSKVHPGEDSDTTGIHLLFARKMIDLTCE
ncbi:MAG: hypothetical protein C4532_13265 [Candidatus Abyssobacteria bacterium SURF_17]|uniref:Uncharacterized protein n=1 Tax=Candidatus Abyssobacteria bacterium SURF_17 TaxID=2093361 RepID=A0A419EUN1_9BACT|nr:MAG: hypothetical protein C4532_13265 [Candidatus Abyssubacteria bacterium SURF_17]